MSPANQNSESPSAFHYWLGVGGAVTVLFLWSGWLVLSRSGLTSGLGIIDLAFLRYGVAIIAVAPFIWKLWPRHVPLRWQFLLAMAGTGYPYAILSFAGLQTVPIAEAGIFQNGFIPVLTAIFVWLIDSKRPSRQAVMGMVVILVGSVALAVKDGQLNLFSFGVGHFYLLLTAAVISFYTTIAARTGITALQIIVVVPTYNGIVALVMWLLWGDHNLLAHGHEILLVQGLYQGLGPSVIGVYAYFLAIKYFGKAETASFMASIPALATCMAIPVLHEYPGLWSWIGIALVSFGILLIVRQKK